MVYTLSAVKQFFSARLRTRGTRLSVERGLMSRLRIAWMGQTRGRHFGGRWLIRAHLSKEMHIR